jgi:hypothetical protein
MIPRVLSAQDVAHCEQVVRFTQSFAVTLDSMKRLQLAASRWQSTTPDFAGTMDCSIDADEQLSCAEAWVLDGKPAAERAKAVSKTIVRCLGREWQSTARRLGDDRAALIIWRPDLRVEFEVGLQSREVVVRQESADSTTVLGEAPKTTLEWRHSLLITGLKAPTTNAATMAWQSDANRLCEDVRAVVASARDDFSSIKKAKNSNDTWSTDIQAHGFGGCDVRRNYYSCESEPVDSLSQLRAGQDALAASLTWVWIFSATRDRLRIKDMIYRWVVKDASEVVGNGFQADYPYPGDPLRWQERPKRPVLTSMWRPASSLRN